jgi:hypothetical protein
MLTPTRIIVERTIWKSSRSMGCDGVGEDTGTGTNMGTSMGTSIDLIFMVFDITIEAFRTGDGDLVLNLPYLSA